MVSHHLTRALVVAATILAVPGVSMAQTLGELEARARAERRDPAAQTAHAEALLAAGRYREARTAFSAAARLSRRAPDALYNVARVAFAEGDYRAARQACQPITRIRGNEEATVLGHVCMARAFLAWNRSARAFEELEAAIAANANHFEAQLALGDAHRLRASVSEAEAAYRRAASANASSALPHLGLGQLYAAANRRDDAVRALRRALELAPQNPEVLYELGRLTTGQEAIGFLRRAAEGRPSWAAAKVALGTALLETGDHAAAKTQFEEAIRLASNDADAHVGLGRALLAAGQADEARASFDRALELVPNHYDAVLGLAEVHVAKDEIEPAFAEYRRAAGLNPSSARALLAAARLALARNRDVLAAGFLDPVLQRYPRHAAALALYGDVMKARRNRNAARQYYQRALRGRGPLDRAHVQRALAELGGR